MDQLDLEMVNSDYDLLHLIRDQKDGFHKELAMGVVDSHSHVIEPLDQVKAGIKKGLEGEMVSSATWEQSTTWRKSWR